MLFAGPMRPLLLRLHISVDGKPFREIWQSRFDEAFAAEDRKHDGHVTLEAAGSIARDMNGSLRGGEPVDLKGIADADGRIERAALLAQIEKTLPPFAVRRRSSIARDSALALFPLLDTNHDNQLIAEELSAAEEQLRQRDFNDDGVVTAGELILDPKAIVAAADPTGADRELTSDESPVVALDGLSGTRNRRKVAQALRSQPRRPADEQAARGRDRAAGAACSRGSTPTVTSVLSADELATFADRAA